VACEKTGRRWLAVEREEEYCEIAARRLEAERRESVLERR
jgi:DNA modification methylase